MITLGRTGGIFSEVSKAYKIQFSKEIPKSRILQSNRIVDDVIPTDNLPSLTTQQISSLLVLSSLCRTSLIFPHAKRYRAFHLNKCFASGQNAPPTSEYPGSSGVQTLFASPTWQSAVPSARTLVGVGQQRRMEGHIFQLFNILVSATILSLSSFFRYSAKPFLLSKDERTFVVFIKQTYQIG